jgi:hypothetical protein
MELVDDAFMNLKSKLNTSETETKLASRRHHEIRDFIGGSWDLKTDFLTGSFRRETKIKPLKDVDIFVVIDPGGAQADYRKLTPDVILSKLSQLLRGKYANLSVDRMACTVHFGAGEDIVSFDVVPAFEREEDIFEIPDSWRGSWITTNPKRHHELSTQKNKECDGGYVPLVKMLKAINAELGGPVTPSFLVEVMTMGLVMAPFGRYQDEVRWLLASAVEGVNQAWPDPAGLGPDVNTMSSHERFAAAQALGGALSIAEEAIRLEDDGQERSAIEEWRKIFNGRMPRP